MLTLIHALAPILSTSCSLEYLRKRSGGSTASIKALMGLQYNDEIYYQMAKGLIPPDLLEMISC